uniref:Membrane bound O-acyltransferase domain containing 1 n=1 Tax=Electrophorus electricus TaxID=8005 RepID=A0A4W4DR68_ELEEL
MGEQSDMSFKTTGSTWLSPLSDLVGIPLDQVNFIICQVFGLVIAFWFRLCLHPQRAGPALRHAVATLLGASLVIFCFGWYAFHIFILTLACYVILCQVSACTVHWYSLIVALGYLTACQVSRVFIFNYGILSTDFSGPLMMITQKITTVAFQVHDGKNVAFPSDSARPSLLEYLSYNLNFLSILVGPCSNYHDYIDFIEGRHVWRKLERLRQGSDLEHDGYVSLPEPSPVRAVCQKLLVCVGCVVWFFVVTRSFPIVHNVDPQFVSQTPFLSRLAYAFVSIQAARPKFYFAWTLADAIHNAAGYGISGMDDKGRVSWDLVSNIHIWEIETATSFKSFVDNWNIQTGAWLKSVCYDRAPHYRTPLTFVLSALWHGVYPGYYFTFLTGIPITLAARAVRRNLRPYFLGSRSVKLAYDVVTWTATQFTVCYAVMPFLLLAVEPTLTYYRSMYFHVHVISILAVILLPSRPRIVKPGNHVLLSNNNVKAE